jgi:nitric oxide reductase subunit C
MLSKSSASRFFWFGTFSCGIAFVLLTLDTIKKVPAQTKEENLTPVVIAGKHLFDKNNCMGCHTILGEGAYYAPELTKVFERRGERFIKSMLTDPQAMYPGERRMVKYNFTDEEKNQLVAFFKWVGEMDLNGFPPKPVLAKVASVQGTIVTPAHRPQAWNQLCVNCHSIGGEGGDIGPALDTIGDKYSREYLIEWITDPEKIKPGTQMPNLGLTKEEINEIVAFLSQLKGGSK